MNMNDMDKLKFTEGLGKEIIRSQHDYFTTEYGRV
jgi:hypothetical protein